MVRISKKVRQERAKKAAETRRLKKLEAALVTLEIFPGSEAGEDEAVPNDTVPEVQEEVEVRSIVVIKEEPPNEEEEEEVGAGAGPAKEVPSETLRYVEIESLPEIPPPAIAEIKAESNVETQMETDVEEIALQPVKNEEIPSGNEFLCLFCSKPVSSADKLKNVSEFCDASNEYVVLVVVHEMLGVPPDLVAHESSIECILCCAPCQKLHVEKTIKTKKNLEDMTKALNQQQAEMIAKIKSTWRSSEEETHPDSVVTKCRTFVATGLESLQIEEEESGEMDTLEEMTTTPPRNPSPAQVPVSASQPVFAETQILQREKTGVISCPMCPTTAPMFVHNYVSHLVYHKTHPYQCSTCFSFYPDEAAASKSPQSNHHCINSLQDAPCQSNFPWYCAFCSDSFENDLLRNAHEAEAHPNPIRVPMTHPCSSCDRRFRSFDEWRVHRALEHPFVAALSCYHCEESFMQPRKDGEGFLLDWQKLKGHLKTVHSKTEMLYQCYLCGLTSYASRTISDHFEAVHQGSRRESWSCDICGNKFAQFSALTNHQTKFHAEKSLFVCELCTFTTPKLAKFNEHKMAVHQQILEEEAEGIFTCPVGGCQYRTASDQVLKSHLEEAHEGEGIYKCDICGKGFLKKQGLGSHKRSHKQSNNSS